MAEAALLASRLAPRVQVQTQPTSTSGRSTATFDYDYEANSEVKPNLGRLIGSGRLRPAMKFALELMKRGSYQVEMSDEGQMTEDIEDCLQVVLEALKKGDLPTAEVIAWCSAMFEKDRVGFIAREPL